MVLVVFKKCHFLNYVISFKLNGAVHIFIVYIACLYSSYASVHILYILCIV